eukprot:292687_1
MADASKSNTPNYNLFLSSNTNNKFTTTNSKWVDKFTITFTHIIEIAIAIQVLSGDPNSLKMVLKDNCELSMDCCRCKRQHRTVCFDMNGERRCTGRQGHKDHPAQLIRMFNAIYKYSNGDNVVYGKYLIGANWSAFTDLKYESKSDINPVGLHPWSRVYFKIKCKKCKVFKSETNFRGHQNNSSGQLVESTKLCRHFTYQYYLDKSRPAQKHNFPWVKCETVEQIRDILTNVLVIILENKLPKEIVTDIAQMTW